MALRERSSALHWAATRPEDNTPAVAVAVGHFVQVGIPPRIPIPWDYSCDMPFTTEASPGSRGAGRCPGLRLRFGSPKHCCLADPAGFSTMLGARIIRLTSIAKAMAGGSPELLTDSIRADREWRACDRFSLPGGSRFPHGGERLPRGRSAGSPKAWVPRPPSRFIRPLRAPAWRRQAEHAGTHLVCARGSGQWPGEGSPDIPRASCPAHWRQALQRSRRHTIGRLARRWP